MSWLIAAMSVLVVVIAAGSGGAASIPSGERTFAQNRLEPVYNDEQAGEIGYIMVPTHTAQPVPSNPAAWAPFYLVVYPVGSTAATTFLCMHTPAENCPSHGDGIAAFFRGRRKYWHNGAMALAHPSRRRLARGSKMAIMAPSRDP